MVCTRAGVFIPLNLKHYKSVFRILRQPQVTEVSPSLETPQFLVFYTLALNQLFGSVNPWPTSSPSTGINGLNF